MPLHLPILAWVSKWRMVTCFSGDLLVVCVENLHSVLKISLTEHKVSPGGVLPVVVGRALHSFSLFFLCSSKRFPSARASSASGAGQLTCSRGVNSTCAELLSFASIRVPCTL